MYINIYKCINDTSILWYNKISHDVKVLENEKQIFEILETFHSSQSGGHSGILVLLYFIYGYMLCIINNSLLVLYIISRRLVKTTIVFSL